ncbi:MAG TPA: hypothetical protein VFB03_02920 [Candidatus Saccharimonadales bacterium]|nr:hypothetical protein [Candidatus Saccharimonadales bacterium]
MHKTPEIARTPETQVIGIEVDKVPCWWDSEQCALRSDGDVVWTCGNEHPKDDPQIGSCAVAELGRRLELLAEPASETTEAEATGPVAE